MLHFALLGRNRHIWMVDAAAAHSYLSIFMGLLLADAS